MPGFQAARALASTLARVCPAGLPAANPSRGSPSFAQGSLFDRSLESPAPVGSNGRTFSRLERLDLGGGAWVDHCQCWLSDPASLFRLVKEETAWQAHTRVMYERRVAVPRLVGTPAPSSASLSALAPLAAALSAHYGRPLYDISFAFYRDGQDSVAMHADKLGVRVDDAIVAIVSLGGPRRFLMKRMQESPSSPASPRSSIGVKSGPAARFWRGQDHLSFLPAQGDLLVMGGSCQRSWQHGVPKARRAEERIAVMFR